MNLPEKNNVANFIWWVYLPVTSKSYYRFIRTFRNGKTVIISTDLRSSANLRTVDNPVFNPCMTGFEPIQLALVYLYTGAVTTVYQACINRWSHELRRSHFMHPISTVCIRDWNQIENCPVIFLFILNICAFCRCRHQPIITATNRRTWRSFSAKFSRNFTVVSSILRRVRIFLHSYKF